jgi:L-2-hydroxyglutarate oxidase LhgO
VIGVGIAREIAISGREVLTLEQANACGAESSSGNSELIHAGIYYPTGSLKARLRAHGRELLYDYCHAK